MAPLGLYVPPPVIQNEEHQAFPHDLLRSAYSILAFASVAIVGLLVEAETCTVGFSPCVPDCNAFCNKKIPGTTGACIKSQCVCSYECLPAKRCNDGLGQCSAVQCWNDCCDQKCKAKHPNSDAVGGCDDSLGASSALCQCKYNCG